MAKAPDVPDPFAPLRAVTPARIGLGRAGAGLPTRPLLDFQLAHAQAIDAVHASLDSDQLVAALPSGAIVVDSAAPDRMAYLQSPDLGRRLARGGQGLVRADCDLALVVADGLSAPAVHAHAAATVSALTARLEGWSLAPVVVARLGRVAIGDPIGHALGARCVVVLIGERPGLSASDSLGAYLTWDPKPGRLDSERNCVSNIRHPGGLSPDQAADKIAWLLGEARRLGLTGVQLKDRRTDIAELPSRMPP